MADSFYMKELPPGCIPFDSERGKMFFKKALADGMMESYFPLAQQFLTQNEPAFCGIGTLCMIMNALNIDPGRTWRTPWRWVVQEMLDCCRPLDHIRKYGITLGEFACLARCNGLTEKTVYAQESSLEEFHEDVISCSKNSDKLLAVAYSRSELGQTGTGHFSPIAGYTDMEGGMILILDVARFKYPSHWVSISTLWDALKAIDSSSNCSRGYSILMRSPTKKEMTSMLRVTFSKLTWRPTFSDIIERCQSATSFDSLVARIVSFLEEGQILPLWDGSNSTLLSSANGDGRETIQGLARSPVHSPSNTTLSIIMPVENRIADFRPSNGMADQPALDRRAAVESEDAYSSALSSFFGSLQGLSTYSTLPEYYPQDTRAMISMFLLALFGMDLFTSRILNTELRLQLHNRYNQDLDGRDDIKTEVLVLRTQMEALQRCCEDEYRAACQRSTC